jgi:hypothetical protein
VSKKAIWASNAAVWFCSTSPGGGTCGGGGGSFWPSEGGFSCAAGSELSLLNLVTRPSERVVTAISVVTVIWDIFCENENTFPQTVPNCWYSFQYGVTAHSTMFFMSHVCCKTDKAKRTCRGLADIPPSDA